MRCGRAWQHWTLRSKCSRPASSDLSDAFAQSEAHYNNCCSLLYDLKR